MNDDWSLKGKKMRDYLDNDYIVSPTQGIEIYSAEDIDTLREKLIKDIDTLYDDNWSIPRGRVIDIINKRFGIE